MLHANTRDQELLSATRPSTNRSDVLSKKLSSCRTTMSRFLFAPARLLSFPCIRSCHTQKGLICLHISTGISCPSYHCYFFCYILYLYLVLYIIVLLKL